MMTLMSVIVAFLFAISLWYLSSNHKVTSVKLKATYLRFLPNRGWHRLTLAGGTFHSATGGTFESDTPGTFVSVMRGTIDSAMPGTFESDTGGTFNPLLSDIVGEKQACRLKALATRQKERLTIVSRLFSQPQYKEMVLREMLKCFWSRDAITICTTSISAARAPDQPEDCINKKPLDRDCIVVKK